MRKYINNMGLLFIVKHETFGGFLEESSIYSDRTKITANWLYISDNKYSRVDPNWSSDPQT